MELKIKPYRKISKGEVFGKTKYRGSKRKNVYSKRFTSFFLKKSVEMYSELEKKSKIFRAKLCTWKLLC